MGRVILHPIPDPEAIERRRSEEFNILTPLEKMERLMMLNRAAIMLNGGKPLKEPQGKGLVIRKLTQGGSL